jgi:hypothetical protein
MGVFVNLCTFACVIVWKSECECKCVHSCMCQYARVRKYEHKCVC